MPGTASTLSYGNQREIRRQIKELLTNPLNRAKLSSTEGDPSVIRVETQFEMDNLNLLDWLALQKNDFKFYWRERESRDETAGIGASRIVRSLPGDTYHSLFGKLHSLTAKEYPTLRLYGGFRFDPYSRHHDPAWEPYGDALFILPRFELNRKGGYLCFAINLMGNELTDGSLVNLSEEIDELVFSPESSDRDRSASSLTTRVNFPEEKSWLLAAGEAISSLRSGEPQKIVLSRQALLDFSQSVSPWSFLSKLSQENEPSFLIGFQPAYLTAFVSASPELLYYRQGRKVSSEAIAGTIRRGLDENEDRKLRQALLASVKDRHEHALVVEGIKGRLSNLCDKLDSGNQPELLPLSRVHHLISRFNGQLRDTVTDANLISALHPTPAVGGFPIDDARVRIAGLEQFDRGWYAGPVGWVGYDSAEFAVAIRCGLISNNRLCLYAGAGIVKGSTPEGEWDEIEAKVAGLLEAATGQ
ncbi:MAG: isochorismate synthase [candidate division Zixibacteria bacterium]|nr:isochorismate synthase [candidate division Zixibacteria bacterium]